MQKTKINLENIVVKSSSWLDSDLLLLFEDEQVHFTDATDISALMKELGIYKSTSEARRAGRSGELPSGWTEYKASKKKTAWIWNPTE